MFATTYRVALADGSRVIVKTAPADSDRLLTYELDLVRTEALVYELAASRPGLLMPRVLHTDFSRSILPTDIVVATHLDGVPLLGRTTATGESTAEQPELLHDLGAVMAHLHTVTSGDFGYPNRATGLVAPTWPEAFGLMVDALLTDADRWATSVPAADIRTALQRHRAALAEVTVPVLVHTDLWAGNLFVDAVTGRLTGVIDPERSLWGDPLFEFAGADQLGQGPVPAALLAGYASSGAHQAIGTPAGDTRLLLYRMYLALVQLVEIIPRRYAGDWVAAHRAAVEGSLRAALTALER
jgi:aminoglycoside phosphotransferase (APT) family kinase protein